MTRNSQAQERRAELVLVPVDTPRIDAAAIPAIEPWMRPAPKRPLRQRPGRLARFAQILSGH